MFNLTYRRLAIQQQHAIVIGACGALGKAVTESIARVAPDVHITTIDVAPSSSPQTAASWLLRCRRKYLNAN